MLFQSTLPWRGVTINIHIQTGIRMTFQSTLSMRRATQSLFLPLLAMPISIHALREESDVGSSRRRYACQAISIHALREESDRGFHSAGFLVVISIHALREESDPTKPMT